MNKDLKNGLIVSGIAVVAYLIYKKATKPKDVLKTAVVSNDPFPIQIGLPVEGPAKPIEQVLVNAPINL
jgi:hypothetical protein